MVWNRDSVTPEYVEDIVRKAALRAGYKLKFADITFDSYRHGGQVVRTKLSRNMGQAALTLSGIDQCVPPRPPTIKSDLFPPIGKDPVKLNQPRHYVTEPPRIYDNEGRVSRR